MSVDALRGFDMLWIVGAGAIVTALEQMSANPFTEMLAKQLKHVEWEGFRFYYLIFPQFLFIVGVSLVLSLDKALAQGGREQVLRRVFRRRHLAGERCSCVLGRRQPAHKSLLYFTVTSKANRTSTRSGGSRAQRRDAS
jgi:predicted acyltransferase